MTPGTGKLYYFKTGKMMSFCSMKCEKNTILLGRKPREQKWTQAHSQFKGKGKAAELKSGVKK